MNAIFNIVIFDRYPVFGSGLKIILERESDLIIQKAFHNKRDLFAFLKKELPDLLVIDAVHSYDICTPLINKTKISFSSLRICVLANRESFLFLNELLHAGVNGIAFGDSTAEEMIQAIHTVLSGADYFMEDIFKRKETRETIKLRDPDNKMRIAAGLTPRENEVLKHFAGGLTYKEIGNILFISPRTVETHKNNIMIKLNLHTKADLIKYAFLNRMI